MPTINKKECREKKIPYKRESVEHTSQFYNSKAWRLTRCAYILNHPLCAICDSRGRITPTTDIHHIIPWDSGETIDEKWDLLLDENNLLPVCEPCHYALHLKEGNRKSKKRLDSLSDTEYNYAHHLNCNNEDNL